MPEVGLAISYICGHTLVASQMVPYSLNSVVTHYIGAIWDAHSNSHCSASFYLTTVQSIAVKHNLSVLPSQSLFIQLNANTSYIHEQRYRLTNGKALELLPEPWKGWN